MKWKTTHFKRPSNGSGTVSYTHLDVYKRQPLALTKALAARRTFLALGKRDRYDLAGALIAGLETAAPRPPLADMMAGCAYPAY